MKALQRPGRTATVIGAVAAVSAGTLIAAVVGTASASAAEPAKCVDNVNVREQPRSDARIVGLCKSGTVVDAGEVRNGFVRLTDLGGWAAQEYVSINGKPPVAGSTGSDTTADQGTTSGSGSGTRRSGSGSTGSSGSGSTSGSGGSGSTSGSGGSGSTSGSGSSADEGTTSGSRSGGTTAEDPEGTGTGTGTGTKKQGTAGDQSTSRTNGQQDPKAGTTPEPKPKPAAPAAPGGLLPGT